MLLVRLKTKMSLHFAPNLISQGDTIRKISDKHK